jgi:O-antigen/teichoic acid export membrane protein
MSQNVAHRAVRASAFNLTASLIQAVIQFGRAVALARLLEPEVFGVYAFASAWIGATGPLAQFGLGSGLLHRAKESEGEMALRVHFTLSLVFSLFWAVALALAGPLVTPGTMPNKTLPVLWILIGTHVVSGLTSTSRTLLVRRVVFRRIALVDVTTTTLETIAAVGLAWQGFGVWSLVATNLVRAALFLVGYLVVRPVWKPRLGWSRDTARYLLGFGRKTFLAGILSRALDQIDDLWTGIFLGDAALGFYARAYRFATYPRAILASPLNSVAAGTYAELKGHRKRLSQAFFRVNAFLLRTGFLFAGLLALIAPELIRLVLGDKWLPMLLAFRLMLIFTLLDPIRGTVASLFVAEGCPEKTVRARLAQLAVLVIGLFLLGPRWGIAGVALTVDLMLAVGILLLLWQARAHVDFSVVRLFAAPTAALVIAIAAGRAAIELPGILGSPWRTGAVKGVVFLPLYAAVLFALERRQVPRVVRTGRDMLPQAFLDRTALGRWMGTTERSVNAGGDHGSDR